MTWGRGHHRVGGQTPLALSRRAPGGRGTAQTPLSAPRRAAHPPGDRGTSHWDVSRPRNPLG